VLRRAAFNIARSIPEFQFTSTSPEFFGKKDGINEDQDHPFYILFGGQNREGKIQVFGRAIKINPEKIEIRTSCVVDRGLNSVKKGLLFNYEVLTMDIPLEFEISHTLPLTDREKVFLLATLRSLKGSSIGGHGSTGAGIIERIEITEDFEQQANILLQEMISGEGDVSN